jgi:hypothetical protein
MMSNEPTLRGYRCFLAITDKVREEMGEFFLQPHRTTIVWGGQKTLFIFMHHSGQFGLYYDLQTGEPVEATAGGGAYGMVGANRCLDLPGFHVADEHRMQIGKLGKTFLGNIPGFSQRPYPGP